MLLWGCELCEKEGEGEEEREEEGEEQSDGREQQEKPVEEKPVEEKPVKENQDKPVEENQDKPVEEKTEYWFRAWSSVRIILPLNTAKLKYILKKYLKFLEKITFIIYRLSNNSRRPFL